MKTLARITKVENGFTYYDEISRVDGHVMISDYMETERFNKAVDSENGFELVCNHPVDMIGNFVIVPAAIKRVLINMSNQVDTKTCYDTINIVRKQFNLRWKDLPRGKTYQAVSLSRLLVLEHALKFAKQC